MPRYAFTGPTRLSEDDEVRLIEEVERLADGSEFTTGGADGADTLIAANAAYLWPCARHRVVHPAGRCPALVPTAAEVVAAPDGREPFRIRNERMLDFADELVAAVRRPTFYRSGEWMTVNIARRRGIPVRLVVLGAAA